MVDAAKTIFKMREAPGQSFMMKDGNEITIVHTSRYLEANVELVPMP